MKNLALWILPLSLLVGCATAAREPITRQQRLTFQDTVRTCERNTAANDFPEAATQLREAKADFYYAEHSLMDPARAETMAIKAQREADAALEMTQRRQKDVAALGTAGDVPQ
jgi:hypothetical protein